MLDEAGHAAEPAVAAGHGEVDLAVVLRRGLAPVVRDGAEQLAVAEPRRDGLGLPARVRARVAAELAEGVQRRAERVDGVVVVVVAVRGGRLLLVDLLEHALHVGEHRGPRRVVEARPRGVDGRAGLAVEGVAVGVAASLFLSLRPEQRLRGLLERAPRGRRDALALEAGDVDELVEALLRHGLRRLAALDLEHRLAELAF